MVIILSTDGKARILVEEGNFTLQVEQVRKEGKNAGQPYWKFRGYYYKLEEALASSLTKGVVVGGDANKVRALLGTVVGVKERLRKAADDFMPAQEANRFDGSVLGALRDNVWSTR